MCAAVTTNCDLDSIISHKRWRAPATAFPPHDISAAQWRGCRGTESCGGWWVVQDLNL